MMLISRRNEGGWERVTTFEPPITPFIKDIYTMILKDMRVLH